LRFRVTRREYATLVHQSCAASVTVSQLIAEAVAEYTSDLDERDAALVSSSVRTFINSLR
jgi:hypothetical protein